MKIILAILIIPLSFSNCRPSCYESRGIEGASLNITFFNAANNEYLYPENTAFSPFKIDSLVSGILMVNY